MSSMPLVFTSTDQTLSTWAWDHQLRANAASYRYCYVRRITHVKNLKSQLVHEYLQVIFEDTAAHSAGKTRVMAERQTAQDQVTIGRWSYGSKPSSSSSLSHARSSFSGSFGSFSSSSSSSGDNLPLPLMSLTFDQNNLSVMDFAQLLLRTTHQLGTYNLITRNCYVFAKTVYDSARLRYRCQSTKWRYSRLAGTLLSWARLFRQGDKDAHAFQRLNESGFRYAPSTGFDETLDKFYASAIELVCEEGLELSDEDRQEFLSFCKSKDLGERVTETALQNIDITKVNEDFQDLVDKVKSNEHYLEVYERLAQNATTIETTEEPGVHKLDCIEIHEPSDEILQQAEQAIKVLVGGVLAELEAQQKEE